MRLSGSLTANLREQPSARIRGTRPPSRGNFPKRQPASSCPFGLEERRPMPRAPLTGQAALSTGIPAMRKTVATTMPPSKRSQLNATAPKARQAPIRARATSMTMSREQMIPSRIPTRTPFWLHSTPPAWIWTPASRTMTKARLLFLAVAAPAWTIAATENPAMRTLVASADPGAPLSTLINATRQSSTRIAPTPSHPAITAKAPVGVQSRARVHWPW